MQDFAQVAWTILINPNVSFVLLVIGVWAMVLAVSVPGTGVPEAAALVCFGLAALGLLQGPVNWLGLLLMGLAVALFLVEFQVTSHGALMLAGGVVLAAGVLVLFSRPERSGPPLSWLTVVAAPLVSTGFFVALIRQGLAAQRRPAFHAEAMRGLVGATGVTHTPVEREGTVYVAGEEWSATADKPIPADRDVVVVGRRGLVLQVAPAAVPAPQAAAPTPGDETRVHS